LAAEMARSEGIPVEMIICGRRRCAGWEDEFAGARGLAGTVFVHKWWAARRRRERAWRKSRRSGRGAIKSLPTMGVLVFGRHIHRAVEAL